MNILMGIGIFAVGGVVGFCVCALLASSKDDCMNCQGIRERDADIYSLTRSRDNFRNRCDQLECIVGSLRTKLGIKARKEQQAPWLEQRAKA